MASEVLTENPELKLGESHGVGQNLGAGAASGQLHPYTSTGDRQAVPYGGWQFLPNHAVGYLLNCYVLGQGHLGRVGEERCAYVRALVVANRALMSRGHLEEQANNWLAEEGTLPPGNGVERDLWEVCLFFCSSAASSLTLLCGHVSF